MTKKKQKKNEKEDLQGSADLTHSTFVAEDNTEADDVETQGIASSKTSATAKIGIAPPRATPPATLIEQHSQPEQQSRRSFSQEREMRIQNEDWYQRVIYFALFLLVLSAFAMIFGSSLFARWGFLEDDPDADRKNNTNTTEV